MQSNCRLVLATASLQGSLPGPTSFSSERARRIVVCRRSVASRRFALAQEAVVDEATDVRSPAEHNTLTISRLFTPDQLLLRLLTPTRVQLFEEALKEVDPFWRRAPGKK